MKYYVSADVHRAATAQETAETGVPNARVFAGRVKTIVDAESPRDAIAQGTHKISAAIEPDCKAINIGCMPVEDARRLGDEESYARMRTV